MKLLNGPLRRLGTSQLELYNLCLHTVNNKGNVTAVSKAFKDAMSTYLISEKPEFAMWWMVFSHYNITRQKLLM